MVCVEGYFYFGDMVVVMCVGEEGFSVVGGLFDWNVGFFWGLEVGDFFWIDIDFWVEIVVDIGGDDV